MFNFCTYCNRRTKFVVCLFFCFCANCYANGYKQQLERIACENGNCLTDTKKIENVKDEHDEWKVDAGYLVKYKGYDYWKIRWHTIDGTVLSGKTVLVSVLCANGGATQCSMKFNDTCVANNCTADGEGWQIEIIPSPFLVSGYVAGDVLGCNSPAVVEGSTCSSGYSANPLFSIGLISWLLAINLSAGY